MGQGIAEMSGLVLRSLAELTNLKPSGVVAVRKEEQGWRLQVELVEKESIPPSMDILGVYDVWADDRGNVLGFERKRLRRRGDTEDQA